MAQVRQTNLSWLFCGQHHVIKQSFIYLILIIMNRTLYLFKPTQLRRKNNTLELLPYSDKRINEELEPYEKDLFREYLQLPPEADLKKDKPKRVPVERILDIHALAPVRINSALLQFLSHKQTPIHHYGFKGDYQGSFLPVNETPNGKLLKKQVSLLQSDDKRRGVCRALITGAMRNMLKVIRAYKYRNAEKSSQKISAEISRMQGIINKMDHIGSLAALRSKEAWFRKIFYRCFDCLVPGRFRLEGRSYNPPGNPANAMISFLNSLLYGVILGEIYRTPLYPDIGVLHEPGSSQFPLVYDLAEIFRPILSERLSIRLIRNGHINTNHFKKTENGTYLNKDGRLVLARAFEKHLRKTVQVPNRAKPVSYRYAIRREAQKLTNLLTRDTQYKAYTISG